MEKVLGLDLGTNSIGFALNEIEEKDGIVIFNPDYAIGKFQSKQTYYKI